MNNSEELVDFSSSQLIKSNLPCNNPKCNSSDALGYYEDDNGHHTKCYSCGEFLINPKPELLAFDVETLESNSEGIASSSSGWEKEQKKNRMKTDEIIYEEVAEKYSQGSFVKFKSRGIAKETCEKYGVKAMGDTKDTRKHMFPFFHRDSGNFIVNKLRGQDANRRRTFAKVSAYPEAQEHAGLFGQQLFPPGGKYITVTTGEYDAMAVYQMTGSMYPCVSVPDGDRTAVSSIQKNWKYLNSFDTIVLCFDNDKSGIKAVQDVVNHFKDSKFKIMTLPKRLEGVDRDIKDPNDYLKYAENPATFTKLWWKAETYTPQDLVMSSSLKERIKERKSVECYKYPWAGLNAMTYGMRKNEITLVKARRGVGKTQVIREIMYGIIKEYPDECMGALFIEETPDVSGEGLMSLSANKRLHLPDASYTEEEWEAAYEEALGGDKIIFYDGSGMNDANSVLDAIEWMYHQTGAQFFILDSLTLMTVDHTQDERKKLDSVSSRLKDMRQKFKLHICCVVHENRDGEVRGSDGPENMANVVFSLRRDQKSSDAVERNTTEVIVEKNRFSGDTGPACQLLFKSETGRLEEKDPTAIEEGIGDYDMPSDNKEVKLNAEELE